ncbi:hypothetical protein [Hubei virga-like virus 15]|uniref:hypothetical protein n=1 Tax=Hubei virga-like virus 15 TaxID=1923330 RepID=UPI00090A8A01|nr:hypothetical protein [Hubei virga-like virus 15]APG77659.1 hypothetical protein [Hubei virga-like virus 15]
MSSADRDDARTRMVDSRGITTIKGGNLTGATLIQSVQDAYTNVMQNAIATSMMALLVIITLAEHAQTKGPLESMRDALAALVDSGEMSGAKNFIASAVHNILVYVVNHKDVIIEVAWIWWPWVVKPSTKNMWMSVVLSFFAVFAELTLFEIVALANAYFLWVSLRNPAHKTLAFIFGMVILVVSLEFNLTKEKPLTPTDIPHTFDPFPNVKNPDDRPPAPDFATITKKEGARVARSIGSGTIPPPTKPFK